MNFLIATQAELLKTKRTASFWLSVSGAALIPVIFFLAFVFGTEQPPASMKTALWATHLSTGWEVMSPLLFPMYVILICTLITHIEYRNNTWKQVYASPVSIPTIYLSKFATIHLMILFCFVLFNLLMLLSGVAIGLFRQDMDFLHHGVDWRFMLQVNIKMYASILGISGLMYWAALRFKNFIAPLGIGLALLAISIIAIEVGWKYSGLLPFAQPYLTLERLEKGGAFFPAPALNSFFGCLAFTLGGLIDAHFRKERG